MIHVLTYTAPHRKTYDVLCLLKARGYQDVSVWAVPMSYVKKYKPAVPHRPDAVPVDSQAYIRNLGYAYTEIASYAAIPPTEKNEVFLLCGGGLLPDGFYAQHTIINSHGGYIPYVRGLDSFKWAVYLGLPLGVTTHIIGEEVDAGEIIERRELEITPSDTFHTAARKSYEMEVHMLVDAIEKAGCAHTYIKGESELFRRMPHALEKELYGKFACRRDLRGDYFVSETSCVDPGAVIGRGTKIWHYSHIQEGAVVGENCVLGQNVNVGRGAVIGSGCKIQNNVSIYHGVTLEDGVFCGPSCVFTNDLTPRAEFPKEEARRIQTLVKHGASIGANATIVCGVTIGAYAMVGAGAVVTRDVPDYTLVAGVPARKTGTVDSFGNVIKEET